MGRPHERNIPTLSPALSAGALLLLAANLCPALTAVGPLVDQIQQATGLSVSALGRKKGG